ncbi:hypothetical protein IGB42_02723 [Andreprevotia sp. IGB-42]|uniref:PulJ/GspJ family protein n=1 Tax=Andreprevotia sp. IGB-42 TaxID=2497473 RepID=UPI0013585902|nr:prepilin-type N-terminal cleavage/methylation domain-containing protein [Andreprevotia sp. IGB-42]KAF0812879.1 hypothetical protein IGB42_02723 [Andreprevotia sp. IGB-42]
MHSRKLLTPRRPLPRLQHGFSLVEMIMALTILAIISATVAIFLDGPIRAYLLNRQRAELVATADASMRRISRDLHLALPNSIRLASSGSTVLLEILQTRNGGMYRDQSSSAGTGDPLRFEGDSAFDTLGSLPASGNTAIVPNQDQLVIFNLGFGPQDAYAGQNRSLIRTVSAGALADETHITFDATTFPLSSPGARFQVISGALTFSCTPGAADSAGNGTGTLRMWRNYTIQTTQPLVQPATGTAALLASNVSACSFQYDPDPVGAAQRNGVATLQLTLTRGGESVSLYNAVHVSNVP